MPVVRDKAHVSTDKKGFLHNRNGKGCTEKQDPFKNIVNDH